MIKKRSNGLSVDMQNDMKSEAIYTLLKNYKNYNYKKYKHQCLPYISELVKRSFAACWNEFIDKDQDFVRNVLHI